MIAAWMNRARLECPERAALEDALRAEMIASAVFNAAWEENPECGNPPKCGLIEDACVARCGCPEAPKWDEWGREQAYLKHVNERPCRSARSSS